MRWQSHLSASQMAIASGLGGLISACSFFTLIPNRARHDHTSTAFEAHIVLSLVMLILGFALSLIAQARLKDGTQSGRWPSQQVEALRSVMESEIWIGLCIAILAAAVLPVILSGTSFSRYLYPSLILVQTISRIGYALRKPQMTQQTPYPLSLAAVTSDHWGER